MSIDVPQSAEIIIVGGGIAGVSTAYHLAALGCRDVLLLEQGQLTCGTTWHAAGLVGQTRATRNATRMSRYGIELYAALERETGLATGWKRCGSLNVARTPERLTLMQRQMARARGFGIDFEFITPAEARERAPILHTGDLAGAVWIPDDGKVNPADLTQSLARGARQRGARLIERIRVTGVRVERGRVAGVQWQHRDDAHVAGEIACTTLVNCAGQWARAFGALAGVNVPLYAAEHFYVVTGPIAGVTPDLPVIRDPDGFIYYKEEVGGLVMGGFEPRAKPWSVDPIPERFEFQLLREDWDQFEILMQSALHRTPCLATADVKMLLNGPESFTPDGNFILGEAPEVARYFVCAGFNSAGIANSGGAGKLVAQWIVDGEAPLDLWDVDIRRFAPFQANRRYLADRTVESLGLHYAMRWPREELASARPLRRSPLYDRLAAKGAVFGSKSGWERASYFLPDGAPVPPPTFGTPGWLASVLDEQRACREHVVVFDQSSFGKLLVKGHDAVRVLQRLAANDVDVAPGRCVYTPMLNARGGFESDCTITRFDAHTFLVVTGSAQVTRDMAWIERNIDAHERAVVVDVTSAYAVLSVAGPNVVALLAATSGDRFDRAHFPVGASREVDIGYARARATRMSYVGGPAFELYVPVEQCVTAYDALHEAGAAFGLRDAGYYALDAMRIEAGRRAWGAELSPDETPFEAGTLSSTRLDKGEFLGRSALVEQSTRALLKRLLIFSCNDAGVFAWGGEPIVMNGQRVGELTSTGYSRRHGCLLAMGYVRTDTPLDAASLARASFEIEVATARHAVTAHLVPPTSIG